MSLFTETLVKPVTVENPTSAFTQVPAFLQISNGNSFSIRSAVPLSKLCNYRMILNPFLFEVVMSFASES